MTVYEILMDQTVQETTTNPESHQPSHWHRPEYPDRNDDFDSENRLYLSLSIAVVVVALLTVLGILICFCRRSKERRCSTSQIITNIELQSPANECQPDQNRNHFRAVKGENITITIAEKY